MDPFTEAAAELGCDQDEIEGTFPPGFVGRLRENLAREQWRKVVTLAYHELTGSHVASDFPEPTLVAKGWCSMTATYEVRILGRLWMPQCVAATTATVTHPMELPQAEGETDAEYEVRMVECAVNTGDFSTVIAMEIERIDVTESTVPFQQVRQVTKTYTTIQAFDEEHEMQYNDCMFPGDED